MRSSAVTCSKSEKRAAGHRYGRFTLIPNEEHERAVIARRRFLGTGESFRVEEERHDSDGG